MNMSFKPNEFELPENLQTLDDLCAQALNYADFFLKLNGCMRPAFFAICAEGPPAFFIFATDEFDVQQKNQFADLCRIFAVAHGAVCSVVCTEAWIIRRERENDELPSEAMDRIETISLATEEPGSIGGMRMAPLLRDGNGKYFGLGEPEKFEGMGAGRFFPLLPKKAVPPVIREAARALIAMKGVKIK